MNFFNLPQYFENTVLNNSERTAIIEDGVYYSFSAIRERVVKVAHYLRTALTHQRKTIIAVIIPKSVDSIIANMAVSYSGNAFINLDIKDSITRLEKTNAHIKPSAILVKKDTNVSALNVFKDIPIFFLEDFDSASPLNKNEKNTICTLATSCLDIDLLCLVQTSGSTGDPKCVPLAHKGFIDRVLNFNKAGALQVNDIIASLSPPTFNIYIFEICTMMMLGSTLVVIPGILTAFPLRLFETINQYKVTLLIIVPSVMVHIANSNLLSHIKLSNLERLLFVGEALPTPKLNEWRKNFPSIQFVNWYGLSESYGLCSYYMIDRPLQDSEPIPMGEAISNLQVLLIKEDNTLAQVNEEGEICIRSNGLALGYYNDPERTAEVFVQNPFNNQYPEIIYRTGDFALMNEQGEMLFRGRKDSIVKHSAYMISLVEIENTILGALPQIKTCCVLYNGQKQIILLYEAQEKIQEQKLKQKLSKILPKYMIPTVYIHMQDLPRNPNGKIDRFKLKKISGIL